MSARYCIWALLLVLAAPIVRAQAPPAVAPPGASSASHTFTIFVRGTPVGREEITVRRDESGTTITSRSRLAPPLTSVVERAELSYAPDWTPRTFLLEATSAGGPVSSRTSFENGTARTEGASAGEAIDVSHPVEPRTVLLPNGVFGAYQALAYRLAGADPADSLRVYIVPVVSAEMRVVAIHDEQVQTGTELYDVRRYELTLRNEGGEQTIHLTSAADHALLRISIPDQGIDVVRSDLTTATARTHIHSNPGDEAVYIPAEGFNLGATLTRPASPPAQAPAVVLVAGSDALDRDGFGMGLATMGQLAGALAESGIVVVRYDRRGHAQSGGRAESATLTDHAEDVRAIVRWLRNRPDVDGDRVALVGHGEGAWTALLATSRERRVAALVMISAASTPGHEWTLEEQQITLDRLTLSPGERQQRVDLQVRVQEAVRTGQGWDDIDPELRSVADTPYFRSLLAFDPARTIDGIRQPLLVVHPALDREVPVAHADRLAAAARRSRAAQLVVVRGVNHLMMPADTGDVREYGSTDRNISPALTGAIGEWLTATLPAR
jgi:uncharacterized protein